MFGWDKQTVDKQPVGFLKNILLIIGDRHNMKKNSSKLEFGEKVKKPKRKKKTYKGRR